MSGATAPLWVTIMLGVLAVVGAIAGAWGGQILAAKRDDRRWERERDREELRWQREREQRNEERRDRLRLDWRERRLEVYSEFLAIVEAWQDQLMASGDVVDAAKPLIRYEASKFEELSDRAAVALKVIRVIGSPEFSAACVKLHDDARFHRLEFQGEMPIEAKAQRLFDWISHREQLLDAVRSELDVDLPESDGSQELRKV